MSAPQRRELILAEDDYCWGSGPLRIRVEKVDPEPVQYHGDVFYQVEGVQLSTTGAEIGRRQALVRGRQLQRPAADIHGSK